MSINNNNEIEKKLWTVDQFRNSQLSSSIINKIENHLWTTSLSIIKNNEFI